MVTLQANLLDCKVFHRVENLILVLETEYNMVAGVTQALRLVAHQELSLLLKPPNACIPVEYKSLFLLGRDHDAQIAWRPERLIRAEVVHLHLKQLSLFL
jgi:hypothetical protein